MTHLLPVTVKPLFPLRPAPLKFVLSGLLALAAPLYAAPVATSLALTSDPPTNSTVLLHASLYPFVSGNLLTDGETITLYSNQVLLGTAVLSHGTASLSIPAPPSGTYDQAVYAGDANFAGSTSNSIQPSGGLSTYPTSLALASSNNNVQMSLAATLYPFFHGSASSNGQPVTFYAEGASIGTGNLYNGVAILNSPLSAPGVSISAVYPGDASLSGTSSNSIRANGAPYSYLTSLGLIASSTHAELGAPVTLTASLYPFLDGVKTTEGEAVTFFRERIPVGTAPLTHGVATLTSTTFTAGTANIIAVFHFDPNFTGATSNPVSIVVNAARAVPTTLTLNADNRRIHHGQRLTLTATLNPFSSAGHATDGQVVTFTANATLLGTASLQNGVATFQVPHKTLPAGTVLLIATFPGDQAFATATSNTVYETVLTGHAAKENDDRDGEDQQDNDHKHSDHNDHDSDHHDSDHND